MSNLTAISLLIIGSCLASISQLLLKISAKKEYSNIVRTYLNFYVITAYALLFTTTVLSVIAFRVISYKYGLAISFASYVSVIILSRIFLKENILRKQYIGIVLIIIGIAIFNL